MREIIISLLALALFLLKVSAKLSDVPFYLPANETFGLELIRERNTSDLAQSLLARSRCGWPAGGRWCPEGQCCNFDGWCGTTSAYCGENMCDFQCPGPIRVRRCGMQAGGRPCPTGQCCRDTVSLVGVEPLQSIVLVKNVKVSEKGHHHPRLHHPHPHHSHRDDAESKLLVEHVLLECAVVYGAGVEPHVTIVVLPTVKVSARAV
ncbi:hypothetical protein T459_10478 [Capsicum annuum]|uniref:Chitin-binding type-1 domain-containing protein n=1 Tax=Capsicum annuum TaxID=4072 RepID=A0A2G3A2C3_CAPAN|nr:hypothetical protein T459_10478 [Capsicum annuum]